jgi:hypothetical protein
MPLAALLAKLTSGMHIGPFFTGAPTCADDILLITNSPKELQYFFSLVYLFAQQARFSMHPGKTKVILLYKGKTFATVYDCWKLGNVNLTPDPSLTHLGIDRYASCHAAKDLILDRIQLMRRTAYALMGVGYHGVSGLNTGTLRNMTNTYLIRG